MARISRIQNKDVFSHWKNHILLKPVRFNFSQKYLMKMTSHINAFYLTCLSTIHYSCQWTCTLSTHLGLSQKINKQHFLVCIILFGKWMHSSLFVKLSLFLLTTMQGTDLTLKNVESALFLVKHTQFTCSASLVYFYFFVGLRNMFYKLGHEHLLLECWLHLTNWACDRNLTPSKGYFIVLFVLIFRLKWKFPYLKAWPANTKVSTWNENMGFWVNLANLRKLKDTCLIIWRIDCILLILINAIGLIFSKA